MSTISLGKDNTQITVSPDDYRVSRNNLGTVTFHNGSGESLTVTFPDGSPFTSSSHTIANGGDWSPTWDANATAQVYNYSVSGGTNTPATADIDIQTTPLP